MAQGNLKYLIIATVFVLFLLGVFFKFNLSSPQAKIKNSKELKKELSDSELKGIKEGLYEFSEKNKIKTTYTYKEGSLKQLAKIRFILYVQDNKKEIQEILVELLPDTGAFRINFYYKDGKTVSDRESDFDKFYEEPDFVVIYNKNKLKLSSEIKDRIADSLNSYTNNNSISQKNFYISDVKENETTITFKATSISNEDVVIFGTINKDEQLYTYKVQE